MGTYNKQMMKYTSTGVVDCAKTKFKEEKSRRTFYDAAKTFDVIF